jgi:hypothetical protein
MFAEPKYIHVAFVAVRSRTCPRVSLLFGETEEFHFIRACRPTSDLRFRILLSWRIFEPDWIG